MRKLACVVVVATLALVPASARAELDPASIQLWDVIYTVDGSVLKGVIVEEIPNTSMRIVIVGGTSIVVQMPNVQKLGKELNPSYRAAPVATVGAAGPASPGRQASPGIRLAAAPGLAYHTEAEASTFYLTLRGGYEIALGQWGLIPSAYFDYVPAVGTYGEDGIAITAGVRAAYRAASVSPFVAFGIGADLLDGDVTLATSMALGLDLIVHPRVALTAEGRYNRGSVEDAYTDTMEYVAFVMGVEFRL